MVLNDIENIISSYISNEYETYIKEYNKLLFNEEKIKEIISDTYDNKWNDLKKEIRTKLKEKMGNDYPQSTVEQTILDITQNKELYINKAIKKILIIQNKNLLEIELPIINNSLNINVDIIHNFIKINSVNDKVFSQEIIDTINNYKFLYSINDIILENYDNNNKILKIKEELAKSDKVKIGLYYLKN